LTITADGKIQVVAAQRKTSCGTGMPLETKPLFAETSAETDPVAGPDDIVASSGVSRRKIWSIALGITLAAGAGGFAIYRKTSAI